MWRWFYRPGVCALNYSPEQGTNAVQKMEGSLKIVYVCGGQANRLAGLTNGIREMDFCKRLSGVVYKLPYAALGGNSLCGER